MSRILIIDDEKKLCTVIVSALRDEGHEADSAYSGEEGLTKVRSAPFDIVVTDLRMPGMDGLDVLREVKKADPFSEVIMMTAYASADTAVSAMKEGAFDYLIKPFSLDSLSAMIGKIREKQEALRTADAYVKGEISPAAVIGSSKEMIRVFKMVGQIAPRDITVMIRGESGTGKELVAQAIHNASPRARRPFVTVNCTALPEALFENELFGHDKEAFTGASSRKVGKFESANSGSLFLDEIGDLNPGTQGKLLRVLEQKSFHRIGGTEEVHVDVRIIAATNVNLESAVRDKKFRHDLYYRLHVFPIWIPPLRERKEDIPLLAAHFLGKNSGSVSEVGPSTMEILMAHSWPGNIRELENVIVSSSLRCKANVLSPEDLPPGFGATMETESGASGVDAEKSLHLGDAERRLIEEAIRTTGGNKTKAAKLLGITRRTLYSKLNLMGKAQPAEEGQG